LNFDLLTFFDKFEQQDLL